MRLISLQLTQWRSYEDCRIDFPDGLIGVRGPNGAGKSTLAEAIGWALFGKLRARAKVGDLRRQGAPRGTRPAVELEFQLGTSMYRIQRVVGGDAKLWINDQLEATKTRDTNLRVAQELGVGKDVFWRTVFAEQKDVAALDPAAGAEARKSHVERLLGLERYKQAATRAASDAKTLKSEIDGLREAADDPNEIKEQLAGAESEASASDPAVVAAQEQSVVADAELKRLAAAVDAERDRAHHAEIADGARMRTDQLKTAIAARLKNSERLAAIQPQLAPLAAKQKIVDLWDEAADACGEVDEATSALKSLDYNEQQVAENDEELEAARAELDERREREGDLRTAAAGAAARLKALRAVADSGQTSVHSERLKAARKEEKDFARMFALAESQLERNRAHLQEVEHGGPNTPCFVCGKKYGDDFERLINAYRDQIVAAETELPNLEKKREQCESAAAVADAALQVAREAEALLARSEGSPDLETAITAEADARRALDGNAARMKELLAEIKKLDTAKRASSKLEKQWLGSRAELNAAQKRLSKALKGFGLDEYSAKLHKAAEAELAKLREVSDEASALSGQLTATEGLEDRLLAEETELSAAGALVDKATASLKALKEKPGSVDTLKQRCTDAEAAARSARESLQEAKLAAQGRSHEVSRLKRELARAQRAHKEIDERVTSMRTHQVVASLLMQFRDAQAKRAWPRLERGASALLAAATDGRYGDVELSEDYRLMIVDRGEKHELARFSGGEQDLANLCLRLAIADWVAVDRNAELSFVVLDEVFGSQDEERRQRLIGELRGLAERFRQVLVITHLPDIADLCDSQLEVTVTPEGASTAVVR